MSNSILLRNGTVLSHDDTDASVLVLRNTDILIENDTITHIARDIDIDIDIPVNNNDNPPCPTNTYTYTVIDCTDKIVGPGFVDTHHHLWQTQLKGRHADESLLRYYVSGAMQTNNYTADDVFWGQLGGALEAVDCGTTCVLDHAHCCVDVDMTSQALSGTISSGLRSIFAYAKPGFVLDRWDQDAVVHKRELDLGLNEIERLAGAAAGRQRTHGDGRVTIGMGFDMYFLPENIVKDAFTRVVDAGVKVITSHVVGGAVHGAGPSSLTTIEKYGLLNATPNLVLSHCTNLSESEYQILKKSQVAISSTPETEAPMGHGEPPFLYPGLHNVSLGVDCHTNNTSFMPQIARTGLFCARLTTNNAPLASGKFPGKLRGTTEQLFNAITVQGARAIGMLDKIGSLRVGKKADIVVFDVGHSTGMSCVADTDPLGAVVRHSDVRDVDTVIIDGIVRKVNGKLCPIRRRGVEGKNDGKEEISWDTVRRELGRSTRDIWSRDASCNHDMAMELVMRTFGTDAKNIVDVDG